MIDRVPNVREFRLLPECRSQHRWRVVSFDFPTARITERCSRCGQQQERFTEAAKRRRKRK